MTRTFAPILLLLAATTFAAELPVSTPAVTLAAGDQIQPQIASDGTNFLVVWRDNRHQDNFQSVWATRVGPDGRMLDLPTGTPISSSTYPPPTSSTNSPASAAWTGSSWLVLWQTSNPGQINVRRVDRDGHLLDSAPRTFAGGTIGAGAVAAAGGRELVVYQVTGQLAYVSGRLLDENGTPVGDPIALPRSSGDMNPVVASNGRSFLVAWWHFDVFPYVGLAAVSRDGVVGNIRYIPTKSMPVIASNGSDFLVVYADNGGAIEAEHVDDQGHFIAQHALSQKPVLPFTGIALTAYGSGYLMSMPLNELIPHPVAGIPLDRDGAPAGNVQITTGGTSEGLVALATNGTNVLAAWPESRQQDMDVYSRIVGVPGSDTDLSRSARVQRFVRTATDGNRMLAVWNEAGGLRANIVGSGGEGTVISTNALAWPATVTFDGANYVVAWLKSDPHGELAYARVSPDGHMLDAVPFTLSHATAYELALSSDGRESLLAWSATDRSGLFALRLDRNGLQLDAPLAVTSDRASSPQIAWNGSLWLVAWEKVIPISCSICTVPIPPSHDVNAARITPSLQLLDPVPIVIAGTQTDELEPSVASNGTDFLVAWSEARDTGSLVRVRHVAANGTLSAITDLSSGVLPTAAAHDGAYAVAWADAGSYFWTPLTPLPLRLPLAINGDYLSSISLLGTPGGFVAAYHRIDDDPASGSVARGFVQDLGVRSRIRAARR